MYFNSAEMGLSLAFNRTNVFVSYEIINEFSLNKSSVKDPLNFIIQIGRSSGLRVTYAQSSSGNEARVR